MALFDLTNKLAMPEKTKLEKQAEISKILDSLQKQGFESLYRAYVAAMERVWDNQDGLTTQEVLDALGTRAVHALQISVATKTYLETIIAIDGQKSPFPNTTLKPLKPNADGTVTVGD